MGGASRPTTRATCWPAPTSPAPWSAGPAPRRPSSWASWRRPARPRPPAHPDRGHLSFSGPSPRIARTKPVAILTLILNILLVLTSLFLICLVLIQRGKGGGLAGG